LNNAGGKAVWAVKPIDGLEPTKTTLNFNEFAPCNAARMGAESPSNDND
jgi:hypothetical protein